ncbi:hypothetical protein Scep_010231 [Stephania cephalantha]|uniref:Uncharacterized protein n=1 Tax=Stephania cephalantha TaxID=152367 RepID=A0AAP0JWW2_9MAGN
MFNSTAARGPTSGGAARVRPAASQRRPTSGGDGLPRRRPRRVASAADLALRAATVRRRLTSSDGAATVQRRCGGSPAVVAESLRRWSRRVSGGGGGLAVKMGLEVKWLSGFLHRDVWTDLGTLYHNTCDHPLGELRPELHQCTRVGVSADLASVARTMDGTVEVVEEVAGKILSSEARRESEGTAGEILEEWKLSELGEVLVIKLAINNKLGVSRREPESAGLLPRLNDLLVGTSCYSIFVFWTLTYRLIYLQSTVQQGEGSTDRRYHLRIPEQFLPLARHRDRAQSVGSIASPPNAAHTAPVSVGSTQSYASTPPQPPPLGPQHQYYQMTDGRGNSQRQGQSSSQVQRQG